MFAKQLFSFNIKTKLILICGFFILCILLFNVYLVRNYRAIQEKEKQISDISEPLMNEILELSDAQFLKTTLIFEMVRQQQKEPKNSVMTLVNDMKTQYQQVENLIPFINRMPNVKPELAASFYKNFKDLEHLNSQIDTIVLNISGKIGSSSKREQRLFLEKLTPLLFEYHSLFQVLNNNAIEFINSSRYYLYEAQRRLSQRIFYLSVIFIVISVLLSLFFILNINQKFNHVIEHFKESSKGGWYRAIPVLKSKDEISKVIASYNNLVSHLEKTMISKDYVDNILKSMADTLVVASPSGRITEINQAALDLLGYQREELVEKEVEKILLEKEGTKRALFESSRLNSLFQDGFVKDCLVIYRTKAGEEIPMALCASVMRDKANQISDVVYIAKDMREYYRLLAEVSEMMAVLKQTQAQLIQAGKLAALGQLGAGVAHELNNPLAVVKGYVQLELSHAEENSNRKKRFEEVIHQIDRMVVIVDNIRGFSRMAESEFMNTSLSEVILKSVSFFREQFLVHDIDLQIEIEKNLPPIMGDLNQLQQVFINIILNARDAVEEKRKKGNFKKGEKGMVRIKATLEKEGVEVDIFDNGCGIAQNIKDKIFDPFFTTKEAGQGTGLGLSITYGLMKDHGGSIEVESKEGEGATFKLTFPNADIDQGRGLLEKYKKAA